VDYSFTDYHKEVGWMDTRIEETLEKHKKGYNCAQAVACTYCDLAGIDEELIFKLTEGFGAGMGSMGCTCGAVSGAIALAGMKNSKGSGNPTSKAETYQISKKILKKFEEMNGSVVCKELKGIDTKKVLRSCDGCIQDAAKIIEEILFDK